MKNEIFRHWSFYGGKLDRFDNRDVSSPDQPRWRVNDQPSGLGQTVSNLQPRSEIVGNSNFANFDLAVRIDQRDCWFPRLEKHRHGRNHYAGSGDGNVDSRLNKRAGQESAGGIGRLQLG